MSTSTTYFWSSMNYEHYFPSKYSLTICVAAGKKLNCSKSKTWRGEQQITLNNLPDKIHMQLNCGKELSDSTIVEVEGREC